MTSHPITPFALTVGCFVGLTVTAAVLWRSFKTGKVGEGTSSRLTDRRTHPVPYWMGMATGAAMFLVALGWVAVHVPRWLAAQ